MTSIAAIELFASPTENTMSTLYDASEQKAKTSPRPSRQLPAPARLGAGSGMIILVLLLLMVATDFVAYLGWTLADGVEVSTAGYVAMVAGVLFSLVVGCGLMALIFYSSRSGYDEPPVLITPENTPERLGQYGRAAKPEVNATEFFETARELNQR
jgi:hypothetical protein